MLVTVLGTAVHQYSCISVRAHAYAYISSYELTTVSLRMCTTPECTSGHAALLACAIIELELKRELNVVGVTAPTDAQTPETVHLVDPGHTRVNGKNVPIFNKYSNP